MKKRNDGKGSPRKGRACREKAQRCVKNALQHLETARTRGTELPKKVRKRLQRQRR
jgi:hypothetical protein